MSPGEGSLGGRPPTHRPRHLRQSQGGEGGGGTGQAGWTGQLRLPTLEGPGTACVCLPWRPPFCSVAKPPIWRKTSGRTDSRWAPLGQMSPKMLIAVNVLNENTSYTQQGGDGSDGSGVRGPWVQRQTSPLAFGDVGRIHSLIQQELHEGLALGYNDKHHSQALPGLQTREGDENNHKQWSHCCKSR